MKNLSRSLYQIPPEMTGLIVKLIVKLKEKTRLLLLIYPAARKPLPAQHRHWNTEGRYLRICSGCQLHYSVHVTRCRPSPDCTANSVSGDRNAISSRMNLASSNLPSVRRRIDLWNCASKNSSFSGGFHLMVMMSFWICKKIFSTE